jgi:hypothetical protein
LVGRAAGTNLARSCVDRCAWCLVHATHMTSEETRRLAASRAIVGHCPITEANLATASSTQRSSLTEASALRSEPIRTFRSHCPMSCDFWNTASAWCSGRETIAPNLAHQQVATCSMAPKAVGPSCSAALVPDWALGPMPIELPCKAIGWDGSAGLPTWLWRHGYFLAPRMSIASKRAAGRLSNMAFTSPARRSATDFASRCDSYSQVDHVAALDIGGRMFYYV